MTHSRNSDDQQHHPRLWHRAAWSGVLAVGNLSLTSSMLSFTQEPFAGRDILVPPQRRKTKLNVRSSMSAEQPADEAVRDVPPPRTSSRSVWIAHFDS